MLNPKLNPKKLTRMDVLIKQGLHDFKLGKLREAVISLQAAVEMGEKFARKHSSYREALAFLAKSLLRSGNIEQALQRQTELLALIPHDRDAKAVLLNMLRTAGINMPRSKAFQSSVLNALATTDISGCVLELVALLLADAAFVKQLKMVLAATDEQAVLSAMLNGEYVELTENPLLQRLMQNPPIPVPDFERLFRKLRKALLQARFSPERSAEFLAFTERQQAFLANFGYYLWSTEYAIFVDTAENLLLTELENHLNQALADFAGLSPNLLIDLSIFTLYQPLHSLKAAQVLLEIPRERWPLCLQKLLKEHFNYQQEQRIKPAIKALTKISDGLTTDVRQQYEENPYPRWHQPPEAGVKRCLAAIIAQLVPDVVLPPRFSEPVDILIAGCGTGYLVFKIAADFELASLLAIDLSLSSLAYAVRMADELQLSGIEFAQADILQLAKFERSFDFIICTGVLHHLEQPMLGWQILNGLLRPGGVMYIGLYSEIARQALVKARHLIADQGLPATPDGMRRLRMDMLDNQYPDLQILLNWHDFYTLSMFRDMAFHVNEHLYTLPQIKSALAELNLTLLGLVGLSSETFNAYRQCFPEDPQALNLDNWALFEAKNPLTFINMYSFYVIKEPV